MRNPELTNYIRENWKTLTDRQMADILKIKVKTVSRHRQRMGLKRNKRAGRPYGS